MNLLLFIGSFLYCRLTYVQGSVKDVTDEFFGDERGDVLAAFGDFNADKQIDIFVLTEDGKQVDLLLSGDKSKSFSRDVLISTNKSSDDLITSVMPGDFNGDSQMDVLITTQPADKLDDPVRVKVYWGSNGAVEPDPYDLPKSLRDQPLLFDWNADMLPDLLSETVSGNRTVWRAHNSSEEKGFTAERLSSGHDTEPFARPTSHAFLDVDGDHIADLVIVTEASFEIWLNTNGVLNLNLTIPKPVNKQNNSNPFARIGQAAFADFDMNNEVEMILPVCSDQACKTSLILVYPNLLLNNDEWRIMVHSFQSASFQWGFVPPEDVVGQKTIKQNFPITLRVGDINSDGHPDALAVLRPVNGPEQKNQEQVAFILQNDACNGEGCNKYSRTFSLPSEAALAAHTNVAQAALFDLYENGILDILTTVATEGPNVTELMAFGNDLRADACFLKITVISGLCGTSCPDGRHPYGVNQPGPATRYKTTRTDGTRQESRTSQLTQSAHYALQLPFMLFGLGPTPNYVEYIDVGIPTPQGQDDRRKEWTSMIPNSQLIVIPHPVNKPGEWLLQLFVTPSHLLYVTAAILLGTCGFFAGLAGILHWKEKREDKREKMQDAQKFHFDAM